jgi:pimeloyl-ACP methyl ester carboxylesterase
LRLGREPEDIPRKDKNRDGHPRHPGQRTNDYRCRPADALCPHTRTPLAAARRHRGPARGTYDFGYYDTGADSLLDLAATLGYLVVAVDRPGYGATHGADPELLTFDAQTTILSQALFRVWTDIGQGAGLVLIGHSIGGMLALCAAATRPAVPLRGVEVSGMGELWQPGLREMWAR